MTYILQQTLNTPKVHRSMNYRPTYMQTLYRNSPIYNILETPLGGYTLYNLLTYCFGIEDIHTNIEI